jgi:hypothetical protein
MGRNKPSEAQDQVWASVDRRTRITHSIDQLGSSAWPFDRQRLEPEGNRLLSIVWLLLMNKPLSVGFPSPLSISYRPVGDLTPDPRNARTHPKRQIDQIKASITAFGFTNPILTDPEGHIIAGHGRLQAARAMGFAEVPTITLSGLCGSPTTRSRSMPAGT